MAYQSPQPKKIDLNLKSSAISFIQSVLPLRVKTIISSSPTFIKQHSLRIQSTFAENQNLGAGVTKKYKPGVIKIGDQISKYESKMLSSPLKICTCFPGSFCYYLFHQKNLLLEEIFYFILFFGVVFWTSLNSYDFVPQVVVETNSLDTLLSFFLGLYVSLHLARWWRLRTNGIGNIWSGSSGIATLLGPSYKLIKAQQIYCGEDLIEILKYINRIRRLCQASLALIFVKYEQSGFSMESLCKLNILTDEQVADLLSVPGSYAEYVWNLVHTEILTLHINYPELYSGNTELSLQGEILKGRSGAGLVGAQQGTQLPLTYVHGITIMGKIYNVILCVTAAIQFVSFWLTDMKDSNSEYSDYSNAEIVHAAPYFFGSALLIALFFLMFKTIAISMLLVFCQKLSEPFDNDLIAFPGSRYVYWIAMDFEILLGFDIENEIKYLEKKLHQNNDTKK